MIIKLKEIQNKSRDEKIVQITLLTSKGVSSWALSTYINMHCQLRMRNVNFEHAKKAKTKKTQGATKHIFMHQSSMNASRQRSGFSPQIRSTAHTFNTCVFAY